MGYKSLDQVLYRELSIAAGRKDIELASPLLIEVINFTTNAFQRCADSSTSEENVDLPILMLYLHLVEMADGVEILIKQSAPTPGVLLLRSMFEAILSIEYILESDYVQRSLSWLTFYALHQLKISEEMDPETNAGREFFKAKQKDKLVHSIDFSEIKPMADFKREILQKLLSREQFKPIVEEVKRSKRKKIRTWYGLFDGPRNIRKLAKRLNREAEYLILYSGWSQVIHGIDISRFLQRMAARDPEDRLLRNPKDIKTIAGFAVSFLLTGTRLVIGKFRPTEDTSRWYRREVQQSFRDLWSGSDDEFQSSE